MTRYASRKFIVAMAAIASASWLVYTGHIADGVYSAAQALLFSPVCTYSATAQEGA